MERGGPKLTLTADAVCSRLLERMREKPVMATVHSVFDHAVNLAFENRTGLVGLIAGEKTLTPYAVSVQTPCSFTELGFRAGMAAAVQAVIPPPVAWIMSRMTDIRRFYTAANLF